MAGIGISLNKIFKKKSFFNIVRGVGYSVTVTIAPMLVVIANIILLFYVLGFNSLRYYDRELFSCSLLYVFIFSLLTVSPFNSVISRYIADKIFEKKTNDILPCFYVGLLLTLLLGCVLAIPFVLHEILKGGVPVLFAFTTFCMFVSLTVVFYTMLFLSVTKDYKTISFMFLCGMLIAFVLSVVLVRVFEIPVIYSVQYGMTAGFFVTAFMEFAYVKRYFSQNSGNYRGLLRYFGTYRLLVVTSLAYTLGLYIHNFIFWTTPMRLVVAESFVCHQPYDMATCIAMFTNISASVIFIVQVETKFHERYQKYSEAVIGGKLKDIDKAKNRMFRALGDELGTLIQLQFIISVALFFIFYIVLPRLGLSGLVMEIYPCLAAGYFIIFIMYSLIIFLYYLDDLPGAAMTALVFLVVTGLCTPAATKLPAGWWGIGVFVGAFCGWLTGYFRIRRTEKHFDEHIFCRGSVVKKVYMPAPSGEVDISEKKHID